MEKGSFAPAEHPMKCRDQGQIPGALGSEIHD
jgi:hypothetical protein